MKITLELTEKQRKTLCMALERYSFTLNARMTNNYVAERQKNTLMRQYNNIVEIRYQIYNQPE